MQNGDEWDVDCGGPNTTSLRDCRFADDFAAMVRLLRTLGTAPAGPKIHLMVPPPLMATNRLFPTMQTTINTLFPKLFPLMVRANPGVLGPIDAFVPRGQRGVGVEGLGRRRPTGLHVVDASPVDLVIRAAGTEQQRGRGGGRFLLAALGHSQIVGSTV